MREQRGSLRWELEGSGPEAYERYLVPAFLGRWADQLLDHVPPRPGDRVLDAGCGTGVVARRAHARVGPAGHVVGVDCNPAMLEAARAAAAGLAPAIDWRVGDLEALPFPDGAFDLVACQQTLQFAADRDRALRELRRVLAPEGRVAINVCRPIAFSPAYLPLVEALRRGAGPAAAAVLGSPFPAWDLHELREALAAAGLREPALRIDVAVVRFPSAVEFLRRQAAASPLAGMLAALTPQQEAELIAEWEEALRPRTDDQGVVFCIESCLASGCA